MKRTREDKEANHRSQILGELMGLDYWKSFSNLIDVGNATTGGPVKIYKLDCKKKKRKLKGGK